MNRVLGSVLVLLAVLPQGRGLAAPNPPRGAEQGPLSSAEGTTRGGPPTGAPRAVRKAERLAGYARLQDEFIVEHVVQDRINRSDESLFATLRTKQGLIIDEVWWFNPICWFRPRYDWDDFLVLFHRADGLLARHSWLAEWKAAAGGRVVELHAFGRRPGSDDLGWSVTPIWRDAGFRGTPRYEVLARRSDTSWVRIFFNDRDPRVLVSYSMDPPAVPAHWLDALDVRFHPRCVEGQATARYAVVAPDGKWQVREVAKCEPLDS